MRYCSKCGYPLNDDQKYCPKCGHLEPSILTEDGVTKPIDTTKLDPNPKPAPRKSAFKVLKGLDKVAYIYSLATGGFLLVYLIVSLFLYIDRHGKQDYLIANQILTIVSAAVILAQAIIYIILFIRANKEQPKNNIKWRVYLVVMILLLVEFAIAIGQLFWLQSFGLSVVSLVSMLVTIDILTATEKMVIKM